MYSRDTIVALATPSGIGGVAVIRVSGDLSSKVSKSIANKVPSPKVATLAKLCDQKGIVDEGLVLFFKGPNSFTGEDVLELHCHGGPVVIDLLLKRILDLGVRFANGGEFTKRAFLNNKIDLVQAEAIADLIESQSELAARASIKTLQGSFSTQINTILDHITNLRIYVEAAIDFPDEELDLLEDGNIVETYTNILHELKSLILKSEDGHKLREGINVVLAGPPNAGKSTLLNALSGRESAIVTDIAGTTRDVIREMVGINGKSFNLSDTAGFRDTDNVIEIEGIKRAKQELENAEHLLWVTDSLDHDLSVSKINSLLTDINNTKIDITIIANKCDLNNEKPAIKKVKGKQIISLSALNHDGIDILKTHLVSYYTKKNSQEGLFIARRRHLDAMNSALNALNEGLKQIKKLASLELIAEDLKLAHDHLGEITGKVSADEMLGKIFSSFCIGK